MMSRSLLFSLLSACLAGWATLRYQEHEDSHAVLPIRPLAAVTSDAEKDGVLPSVSNSEDEVLEHDRSSHSQQQQQQQPQPQPEPPAKRWKGYHHHSDAAGIGLAQALGLGRVLLGRGEAEEAALAFRLAVGEASANINDVRDLGQAKHLLGLALRAAGRPIEALEACREAELIDPALVAASACVGALLTEMGDAGGALKALRTAAEKLSNGNGSYGSGTPGGGAAAAAATTAAGLEGGTDASDIYGRLGAALLAMGELDEAVSVLMRALDGVAAAEETRGAAAYNLGVTWQTKGETEKAIVAYAQAVELAPDLAPPRVNLGAQLLQRGRLREAEAVLLTAVRLGDDASTLAAAYANLGAVMQRSERPREALEAYSQAARWGAGRSSLMQMAKLHQELGNPQQALDAILRAQRLSEDELDISPLLQAGLILESMGQCKEAVEHLAKVLEIDPDNVEAMVHLGSCKQNLGLYHEALGAFARASGLDPKNPEIYDLLFSAVSAAKAKTVVDAGGVDAPCGDNADADGKEGMGTKIAAVTATVNGKADRRYRTAEGRRSKAKDEPPSEGGREKPALVRAGDPSLSSEEARKFATSLDAETKPGPMSDHRPATEADVSETARGRVQSTELRTTEDGAGLSPDDGRRGASAGDASPSTQTRLGTSSASLRDAAADMRRKSEALLHQDAAVSTRTSATTAPAARRGFFASRNKRSEFSREETELDVDADTSEVFRGEDISPTGAHAGEEDPLGEKVVSVSSSRPSLRGVDVNSAGNGRGTGMGIGEETTAFAAAFLDEPSSDPVTVNDGSLSVAVAGDAMGAEIVEDIQDTVLRDQLTQDDRIEEDSSSIDIRQGNGTGSSEDLRGSGAQKRIAEDIGLGFDSRRDRDGLEPPKMQQEELEHFGPDEQDEDGNAGDEEIGEEIGEEGHEPGPLADVSVSAAGALEVVGLDFDSAADVILGEPIETQMSVDTSVAPGIKEVPDAATIATDVAEDVATGRSEMGGEPSEGVLPSEAHETAAAMDTIEDGDVLAKVVEEGRGDVDRSADDDAFKANADAALESMEENTVAVEEVAIAFDGDPPDGVVDAGSVQEAAMALGEGQREQVEGKEAREAPGLSPAEPMGANVIDRGDDGGIGDRSVAAMDAPSDEIELPSTLATLGEDGDVEAVPSQENFIAPTVESKEGGGETKKEGVIMEGANTVDDYGGAGFERLELVDEPAGKPQQPFTLSIEQEERQEKEEKEDEVVPYDEVLDAAAPTAEDDKEKKMLTEGGTVADAADSGDADGGATEDVAEVDTSGHEPGPSAVPAATKREKRVVSQEDLIAPETASVEKEHEMEERREGAKPSAEGEFGDEKSESWSLPAAEAEPEEGVSSASGHEEMKEGMAIKDTNVKTNTNTDTTTDVDTDTNMNTNTNTSVGPIADTSTAAAGGMEEVMAGNDTLTGSDTVPHTSTIDTGTDSVEAGKESLPHQGLAASDATADGPSKGPTLDGETGSQAGSGDTTDARDEGGKGPDGGIGATTVPREDATDPVEPTPAVVDVSEEDATRARSKAKLGLARLQKGQMKKALSLFEKATSIDPGWWGGFYYTALAQDHLGNAEAAARALVSALGVAAPTDSGEVKGLTALASTVLASLGGDKESSVGQLLKSAMDKSGLTFTAAPPGNRARRPPAPSPKDSSSTRQSSGPGSAGERSGGIGRTASMGGARKGAPEEGTGGDTGRGNLGKQRARGDASGDTSGRQRAPEGAGRENTSRNQKTPTSGNSPNRPPVADRRESPAGGGGDGAGRGSGRDSETTTGEGRGKGKPSTSTPGSVSQGGDGSKGYSGPGGRKVEETSGRGKADSARNGRARDSDRTKPPSNADAAPKRSRGTGGDSTLEDKRPGEGGVSGGVKAGGSSSAAESPEGGRKKGRGRGSDPSGDSKARAEDILSSMGLNSGLGLGLDELPGIEALGRNPQDMMAAIGSGGGGSGSSIGESDGRDRGKKGLFSRLWNRGKRDG